MTGDDIFILLVVYVTPSLAALVLSCFAKSRIARGLLATAGAASLAALLAIVVAETDCQREIVAFFNCNRLPRFLSDAISVAQIFYLIAYTTLGPVLLIIAAIAEWLARRSA